MAKTTGSEIMSPEDSVHTKHVPMSYIPSSQRLYFILGTQLQGQSHLKLEH